METRIPRDPLFDSPYLEDTIVATDYPFFFPSISWSAIFAGLVTALATSICLSFFVAALGLGQIDPYSSSPFGGSFLSVGIGSLIVMLFSLASGSFIAGRFAQISGALHGFLTWALLTLLMTIQATLLVSSVASLSAQAALENNSGAPQSTLPLGTSHPPVLTKLNIEEFEHLLQDPNNNGHFFDQLRSDLRTLLNKSDISALNSDRLQEFYKAAVHEINSTITAYKKDPTHYHTYLKNLSDRLSNRAQTMIANINQKEVINSLIHNGMTPSEAQTTANHALHVYQTAEEKTEQAIKALEEQAHKLFTQLDNASTKDARDTANKAAKAASSIGWWGFLGGLIGAIISSIFGYYGYRSRKDSFML
ncbi:TIGR04086 family membrane protein [Bartonella sp. CB74]|uniref:TIGR04086 family membrane protein n=1 Tax=Bartonella sp. CB74 TaxID=3113620 RepID=UPI002F961F3E